MKKAKKYKIEGELNKVIEILSNLELFGKLHPLIKRVEKLNKEKKTYIIYEKPFNWLSFNIKYKAEVVTKGDLSIEYHITEIPLTKAIINYNFKEQSKGKMSIELIIEITSRVIGKQILMSKMIDAQDKVMHSIQNKLKEKDGN